MNNKTVKITKCYCHLRRGAQLSKINAVIKNKGINIDYYPSNFVVDKNNNIFYIDYECNKYDPKWDYDNWGKQYWEKNSP